MRDDAMITRPYKVVILTLDSHAAGPCERAALNLGMDFPGLELKVHAAAEWGESDAALAAARADIASGDILIANLLFLEDHINAILPDLEARRENCDALAGIIADAKIVRLTRMGTLDMQAPESGTRKLMKKLRGQTKQNVDSGAKKMKMLRRLPPHPQAHPRQGAGPARLVSDDAILARRVGRECRRPDPLPHFALLPPR